MTITKGYKATDKDMKCRGLQFVLGEWQEVEGELIECENGLHFCTELAHTYEFYGDESDRRFECEVEDILEIEYQPGVICKRVARRIKLIKELTISGHCNTGNSNTGDINTGNSNTGNSNTGDINTGDRNTGNWNTGNWNTGDRNTGNWNTGYGNTGHSNTGSRNTGDWSTGDWNHCDRSAGFFGSIEPKVTSFDEISEYTYVEYKERFGGLVYKLGKLMASNEPIDVAPFTKIPNITQEKLDNLHQKFIESRKKLAE
jgi:Pentapeptide repeats (8 copies)